MNVLRPRGRHRLGLSCGIFGNGFALAAETLRHVPYTANSLVEDLEYHLHLLRAGLHVDFVDEAAVLGEMPEASAAAATQRARWEGGRILMRRQWAGSLALQVISGRLQMLEPLLDLLAFPLATEAALLAAALALGAVCHSAVLEGFSALGLLTLVLYVAVAASLAPQPAESLRAVAAAPAFLFWKILQIPRTRRAARADAAWVRTGRN
jgi:cellulose synthase/poly-beta-1,6-N-acetylglucosamine synthase-like glycosyltransferase